MKRHAVWVTIAAMGLLAPGAFAQQGGQPGKQGQQGQMGQMGQPKGAGMAETALFDDGDFRALATEAQEHIELGRSHFGMKQNVGSSTEFRRAAVMLKLSASHFAGDAKGSLMQAAQLLENLADEVGPSNAKQRPGKEVDADLAYVEQVLAQFHEKEAANLWSSKRDPEQAGYFLKAAAKELDNGFAWSGKKRDKDDKKRIDAVTKTASEMIKGTATPDAVDKALDDVNGAAQKLAAAVQTTASKQLAVTAPPALDDKDWIVLQGEVIDELKLAKKGFGKNGNIDTAEDMRQAAALLKLQASRSADAKAKAGLTDVAKELGDKAQAARLGTIKRANDLDTTFAKADLALATSHHGLAQKEWGEKKTFEAGSELGSAAVALDQALDYKVFTAPATTKKAIADAKKISGEMVKGSGFQVADVDKVIDQFGAALAKVSQGPARQAQKPRRQAKR